MRKEPLKFHRPGGIPYVIADSTYPEVYVRLVAKEVGLVVGVTVRYVCNCPAEAWVFLIGELSEEDVEQLMFRMSATEVHCGDYKYDLTGEMVGELR